MVRSGAGVSIFSTGAPEERYTIFYITALLRDFTWKIAIFFYLLADLLPDGSKSI